MAQLSYLVTTPTDQRLCFCFIGSIILLLPKSIISSLLPSTGAVLDFVGNLEGFLVTRLILSSVPSGSDITIFTLRVACKVNQIKASVQIKALF